MFDGMKLTFTDRTFITTLYNNKSSYFTRTIDSNAQLDSYTAIYKGLKIRMYEKSGYVIINGSLHKFFNDGQHNHNDFSIKDLGAAINSLVTELDLDPKLAVVSNLEFGVNIRTLFNPDALLNDLIRYKDKPFNTMKIKGKGKGNECYLDQYGIKIYNKGLQYNLESNVLRIEKKITKMRALKYGKIYLNDLLDTSLWQHCKRQLLELIDDLTIHEQLDLEMLDKRRLCIYNTVMNQCTWNTFHRSKKCRYRKDFNKIILLNGNDNYKSQIINAISSKCDELIMKLHGVQPK